MLFFFENSCRLLEFGLVTSLDAVAPNIEGRCLVIFLAKLTCSQQGSQGHTQQEPNEQEHSSQEHSTRRD